MGHRDDVLTDVILDIWRGDCVQPIQNKVCDINIHIALDICNLGWRVISTKAKKSGHQWRRENACVQMRCVRAKRECRNGLCN